MIRISEKVLNALRTNKPVVALESTIISHGMPYPKNVQTALDVEKTIEKEGVVAATIGIIDGVAIIGMSPEEIEQFGKRHGICKVSRRDLPVIFARKMWGATTVAATMILAKEAGIEVFVTGGIGGVHRGAPETFDISADLQELSNTDVTVVCAGAKAILDLPLTLEYLETFGVTVLGYQTNELADFYTRHSGLEIEYSASSPADVASIIFEKRASKLKGGVLISNPIPEKFAMDKKVIDSAITQALADMKKQGVHGKEVTPFLLKRVVELTGGDSLEANIALVLNNATLGALIAKEFCALSTKKH